MTTRGRIGLMAALALAMLVAGGCRRRPVVASGGLTARQHTRLLRYAERHTGCNQAQLSPALISSPPNVYTVTGCAQPVEYWQQCSRRRCRWQRVVPVGEVASEMLQCPPNMIQQQPTQAPGQRAAIGCGRAVTFQMSCTGRDCLWTPITPVQTQGQAVASAPQGYQQQGQVHVQGNPGPAGGQPPSAALSAQVQQHREAVMSCLDPGQNLTLSLRWTAQGQVILQLPDNLAGTAAEGCIQAALGALQVAAAQPGEVSVPIN